MVLLFLISIGLFLLASNMGDPLATFGGRNVIRSEDRIRLTRQLGLDKPIWLRYVFWLVGDTWYQTDMNGDGVPDTYGTRRGVLRGDLSTSIITRRPVAEMIRERVPYTLLLMLTSEAVIIMISLVVGMISALKQYSLFDHAVTTLSFIGFSLPIPILALGLIYIFGYYFKVWGLPYFPTGGLYDPEVGPSFQQTVWHMALPVTAISIITTAGYSRYVRSNMLEVLQQDYIRTARAKGMTNSRIIFIHALKNAALPIVTIVGLDLPFLFSGALVTESIFAWPGMGRLFWEQTVKNDTPVMMGIVMIIAVLVVVFQLLTDLTYTLLDPRIRYD